MHYGRMKPHPSMSQYLPGIILAVILLTLGCQPTPESDTDTNNNDLISNQSTATAIDPSKAEDIIEEAQRILTPFKTDLMAALQKGMTEGPARAIEICQLQAPTIAAEASAENYRIGRTSHKLRNPVNTPSAWVEPVLAEFVEAGGNLPPRAIGIDEKRIGYLEPIMVQPQCLACHGSDINETIQARINERYPNDQATGFNVGEFRGLFWVEFKSDHFAQ